jgi:hypothetical protein
MRALALLVFLVSGCSESVTLVMDADAGAPLGDASVWPVDDAGPDQPDAVSLRPDACRMPSCFADSGVPVEEDAGLPVEEDAGLPVEEDAGSLPVDAGAPDAGSDAGTDAGGGDRCTSPGLTLPCSSGCSGTRTCLDTGFWSVCECSGTDAGTPPDAGSCGGAGERCCDSGPRCFGAGAFCGMMGTCEHCGGDGEVCCPTGDACEAPLGCSPTLGTCGCGGLGEVCCPGSDGRRLLCESGLFCNTAWPSTLCDRR